jgi:anti-sigma regulatory factor (Ser/Thr protein kinase)
VAGVDSVEDGRAVPASFEVELRSDVSEAKRLREELAAWLDDADINGSDRYEIVSAVSEAFLNAIEHPFERASERISVSGRIDDNRVVFVEVADDGQWKPIRDSGRAHLGYALMCAAVDSVQTINTDQGTTVRLRHRI